MPAKSIIRDIAYTVAVTVASPIWGYKWLSTGKWRTDWKARLGHCPLTPLPGADGLSKPKTLLIHAVSVGEIDAIRQLVQTLGKLAGPALRVVVSTTTDTGTARARTLYEPDFAVVRYPFDFSRSVHRFLDAVRPDLVALVELEVWPNFVDECTRRGIPVAVINGRLSARSFKAYRRVRPLVAPMFRQLARVGAQSREIADRFIAVGAPAERVSVTDTMKWDTAEILDTVPGSDELAAAMGIDTSKPLIVAGSTGPGEEEMLIRTCPQDVQLLLVPRKPERFDEVARLADTFEPQRPIVRRTRYRDGAKRPLSDQRLFLLDTIGELRKAYALADVVLVGRSFLGLYGSNMLEPIGLGKPTIIGTHHSDFADVMRALIDGQGILVTDDPGPAAAGLLADKVKAAELARRGREVILARKGATLRHAHLLLELLGLPKSP
ncbi:MAG: hypothetical protein IT442_11110 [Phycisphaeraceae bacterium]|nr:hypothetical protein [Phycisphaeraceae bacterium]